MKIVPAHPEIEIEDVPTNFLAGFGEDGWRVADEGPTVHAVRGHAVATQLDDAVEARPVVHPRNGAPYPDDDRSRNELKIDDADAGTRRPASLHGDLPCHARAVNAADVVVVRRETERGRLKAAAWHTTGGGSQRRALENRRPAGTAHLMQEDRHV